MEAAVQALIAAAIAFVVVSLFFLFLSIVCRRRRPSHPVPNLRRRSISSTPHQVHVDECKSFDPSLSLSLPLLSAATRDFDSELVVGDGSFGLVYKAVLPDGTPLAVKRLSSDAFHGLREFRAEIDTLGRIRHPHLARFLGYCISGPHRLLVYEFLHHGSLDQWLHEHTPPLPLSFQSRLKIVLGVARGLSFLHHGCNPSIIHRDIKSSNVLLDNDLEARIADFGLAREVDISRSHVSTQVAGTMGYMPPEYRDGMTAATVKADVYSFGVLMLEVVTGKRPNLPVAMEVESGRKRDVGLVWWARRMVEEGKEGQMADFGMDGVEERVVKGYLAVAITCTSEVPKQRPSMAQVVEMLDEVARGG